MNELLEEDKAIRTTVIRSLNTSGFSSPILKFPKFVMNAYEKVFQSNVLNKLKSSFRSLMRRQKNAGSSVRDDVDEHSPHFYDKLYEKLCELVNNYFDVSLRSSNQETKSNNILKKSSSSLNVFKLSNYLQNVPLVGSDVPLPLHVIEFTLQTLHRDDAGQISTDNFKTWFITPNKGVLDLLTEKTFFSRLLQADIASMDLDSCINSLLFIPHQHHQQSQSHYHYNNHSMGHNAKDTTTLFVKKRIETDRNDKLAIKPFISTCADLDMMMGEQVTAIPSILATFDEAGPSNMFDSPLSRKINLRRQSQLNAGFFSGRIDEKILFRKGVLYNISRSEKQSKRKHHKKEKMVCPPIGHSDISLEIVDITTIDEGEVNRIIFTLSHRSIIMINNL